MGLPASGQRMSANDTATARELTVVLTILGLAGVLWLLVGSL